MKKRILSFLLLICVSVTSMFGLVGCDESGASSTTAAPQKPPESNGLTIEKFNRNFDSYTNQEVEICGVVYMGDKYGLFITDSSGATLYVKTDYENIAIGQTVTVVGTANMYYTLPQILATSCTGGEMAGADVPVYNATVAEIIVANRAQASCVFDHTCYRAAGVLTQEGGQYYLVDGTDKLQIKTSTYVADYNTLISYVGQKIAFNFVFADVFSTTGIPRIVPLTGSDADIKVLGGGTSSDEPTHIRTTVAELAAALPTSSYDVVYEVTATWQLKDGGSTYGNGWLTDANGNRITVYGLCKDATVLNWANGRYTFSNDRSYSQIGLEDGAVITVGMVYSTQYDNYSCYLIEIVSMPEAGDTTDINFVMINDTHGAFTDSSEGNSIGRVDTLVQALESRGGEHIFILNGDAFQGSYVCVETYGRAMVDALNQMELDCFVIGNHEFDWGLDKIAAYADGDPTNGEANFPFLGANIYYKGTTTRPDWIDAYTIIEQDGMKIGIIGAIGYGQESSILTSNVEDYTFADPLSVVRSYSTYLRETEACDVVVVAIHDYDDAFNYGVAELTGTAMVDAVFCAHTHQNITDSVMRSDREYIPVVQCYDKNDNAVEVVLRFDEENAFASYTTVKHEPENYAISSRVQEIIENYQDIIDESNKVIGSTSSVLSRETLGEYAVDALLEYDYSAYNFEGVDVSIINTGGVRAEINYGEITKGEVFEVFPFNNAVVLVNISGALLKSLCRENRNYLYIEVSDEIGTYTRLDDQTIYQLAIIDYVFEGTYYYQFDGLSEDDYMQTDIIMRNILIAYLDQVY